MASSSKLLAVFYGTGKASACLVVFSAAAPRTGVVFSHICAAQTAIQAARRNDLQIVSPNLSDLGTHAIILALREFCLMTPNVQLTRQPSGPSG